MAVPSEARSTSRQHIARLTPLDDVLARIRECVAPVMPRDMRIAAALGATLARDVVIAEPRPAAPIALIDGWAVGADATIDAGAYAPAIVSTAHEVAVGEPLGHGNDAVAAFDALTWRGGVGEVHAAVTAGEGVLLPGTDAAAGEVLRAAGRRLRSIDIATMHALGVASAPVRKPRIRLARTGKGRNDIADAIVDWLAGAIAADGGEPVAVRPGAGLEPLLTSGGVDAVAIVGGTGAGPTDDAALALARAGTLEAHGIAISPGETAAFGLVNSRPVILIPGRLDAAVAVWLLIGRAVVARLSGSDAGEPANACILTGKVTSTIGLTELVPVRRREGGVEPLASKYLPLATLAHADGWIAVPAASEGLAAGASVMVRPLP